MAVRHVIGAPGIVRGPGAVAGCCSARPAHTCVRLTHHWCLSQQAAACNVVRNCVCRFWAVEGVCAFVQVWWQACAGSMAAAVCERVHILVGRLSISWVCCANVRRPLAVCLSGSG